MSSSGLDDEVYLANLLQPSSLMKEDLVAWLLTTNFSSGKSNILVNYQFLKKNRTTL
ncbi:hypothetical protein [Flavobacterium hiemivividum]|uniref:hypothetical protein n=1 Tax=Flavobacterium hiemivividum TaxID=2541734 RepID=UPI001404638C|nr:hypothetical protein [Flavobacterium hiemivividum]